MKSEFKKGFRVFMSVLTIITLIFSNTVVFAAADDPAIPPVPQISGTVFMPDGQNPATSGYIEVLRITGPNNAEPVGDGITLSAEGKYEINGLQIDEEYVLIAYPGPDINNIIPSIEHVITINNEGQPVYLNNQGQSASVINFQLCTVQIQGTVSLPEGNLTESVYVDVLDGNNNVTRFCTDENGKYVIGGLEVGEKYNIYALPPDSMALCMSVLQEVTIKDSPITIDLALLSPQISGTVGNLSENDNKGIVYVFAEQNQPPVYRARIGGNGEFYIAGLNPGIYILKACPYYQDMTRIQSDPLTLTVEENEAYSNVNLQLKAVQVSGHVYYPGESHNSVNSGHIIVRKSGEDQETRFDIYNGEFAVGGLDNGTYYLRAASEEKPEYCDSNLVEITINGGVPSQSQVDFTMISFQISGTVSNLPDTNHKGTVVVMNMGHDYICSSDIQNDGKYYLGGLQPGKYIIKAYPNGQSSTCTESEEYEITIEANDIYNNINLTFGSAQIVGNVFAPDNMPSGYGWVDVYTGSGNQIQWIKGSGCNPQGRFVIGGLAEGVYTIKAMPSRDTEYCESEGKVIRINNNGKYVNEDGSLANDGTADNPLQLKLQQPLLKGVVKGPGESETVIPYGRVEIFDSDDHWIKSIPVNKYGVFAIGSLANGSYKIQARPENNNQYADSDMLTVTVDSSKPVSDLVLRLKMPQITGRVFGPDNSTLCRFGHIEIRRKSDGRYQMGVSVDWDGRFLISGLPKGEYYLTAVPKDSSDYSASTDFLVSIDENGVSDNGNVTLTLTSPQITGIIKAGNSNAAHCCVEVRKGQIFIKNVGTDNSGNFKIGALSVGRYTLIAHPGWNYSSYCKSDGVDVVIGDNGSVAGGGNITLSLKSAQVTGTVTKPNNGGNSRYGWIEVKEKVTGHYVQGTGINSQGVYSLSGLENGKVYILKAYPDRGAAFAPSSEVEVTIGGNPVTCNLVLNAPQVTGTVLLPVGAEPAQYSHVEVWRELQNGERQRMGGYETGSDGKFYVSGLEQGIDYKMKAYPGRGISYSASLEMDVKSQDNNVSIVLTKPDIAGSVKGPNEQNVSFGHVELIKSTGEWVLCEGIDREGNFKVGGLTDGQFKIRAYPTPDSEFTPSEWIECSKGSINLQITYSTAQLTGTVTGNRQGESIRGWIEIRKQDPASGQYRWLNGQGFSNGTFRIGGLESGSYEFRVHPDGISYTASSFIKFIIDDNGNSNKNNITVPLNTPQISGSVEKSGGTPYTRAYIQLLKNDGAGKWDRIDGIGTDYQGNFSFGGLENGEYRLIAYPQWNDSDLGPSGSLDITISNGSFADNQVLTLTSIQVHGVIDNYEDGAWVEVGVKDVNNDIKYVKSIPVNRDGSFRISGLDESKSYVVQAFAQNKKSGVIDVTSFNNSQNISLTLNNTVGVNARMASVNNFGIKSLLVSLDFKDLGIMLADGSSELGSNSVDPEPAFISISTSINTSQEGSSQAVDLTINTQGIDDGTAITAMLMDEEGENAVEGVNVSSGTVTGNKAMFSLLIPSTVSAGNYTIKLTAASLNLSDISTKYCITQNEAVMIDSVTVSSSSHKSGDAANITVGVVTRNADDGVQVTAELVDNNGSIINNVSGFSNIKNDSAEIGMTIPADTPSGSYRIKVQVSTTVNMENNYNIVSSISNINDINNNSLVVGNFLFDNMSSFTREKVIQAYYSMEGQNNVYYKTNDFWYSLTLDGINEEDYLQQKNSIIPNINVNNLNIFR